jgi:hypothetical protein
MKTLAGYRGLCVALAAAMLASCTTSTTVQPADSALAPAMVIERFLRAANSNDLDTMGRLFGTRDGPWAPTVSKKEADDRLFVIASVLRHTDYQVVGEQIVPGRRDEATQLVVRLVQGEQRFEVPFTLVRSQKDGWLVEVVPLDLLTNRRSG